MWGREEIAVSCPVSGNPVYVAAASELVSGVAACFPGGVSGVGSEVAVCPPGAVSGLVSGVAACSPEVVLKPVPVGGACLLEEEPGLVLASAAGSLEAG